MKYLSPRCSICDQCLIHKKKELYYCKLFDTVSLKDSWFYKKTKCRYFEREKQ